MTDPVAQRSVPEAHRSLPRRQHETDHPNYRPVTFLTIAGFCVPIASYFWLIHRYAVNAVWYDQWDDIKLVAHPTLEALWAQHNEHRMFFPNLIVLGLAHTTHLNIQLEDYLSGLLLVASIGLLISAHRRRSLATPWLYYCPVAIILLSFVQVGNTLWGFQMAWYLIMFALASAIFLLDQRNLSGLVLSGAITAAIVGSFSSLQGLLIWPTGLILLYCRSRPKGVVITWVASGLVTTAIYFHHLGSTATGVNNTYVFSHPLEGAEFFFLAIGDVVGQPLPLVGLDDAIMLLGIVFVALAIWTMVAYGFRRNESASPIGVSLTCFGLMFAATITQGRISYGLQAAGGSRYTTFDLLILVGCYLTVLGQSAERAKVGQIGVRIIVGGSIVLLAVLGTKNGLNEAATWHQILSEGADVTVNIDKAPNSLVEAALSPGASADVSSIRRTAQIAKTEHLSLFATDAVSRYRKAGLIEPPPATNIVSPLNGTQLSGSETLNANASDNFGITVNVTKVEFRATGEALRNALIGTAKDTYFGWLTAWDTRTVSNGNYTLHSVAYNAIGKVTYSKGITVTVTN
jgi:hypothetical protein